MAKIDQTYPWLDGIWLAKTNDGLVSFIKGNSEIVRAFAEVEFHPDLPALENNIGVLESGDFGEVDAELKVSF